MPNEVNIYDPRYLAAVVRQVPPVNTFFRSTFFTNMKTFPTERVDIDLVKGDRRMAAFVSPRVGGKVMDKQGYATKSYAAPLVNPCDVTYADKLMKRLPGEDPYSGKTPAQRAAEKLKEDYQRLNDAATRRVEWMCARAIVDGKIVVKGEGVDDEIDFQHTNRVTLTGTAQWGKAGAKILENLEEWDEKVLLNGFVNVDMALMGKTALRAFLADETVLKALDNRRVEMGLIHPKDLPNGVKYIGHLNKPNVDIYTSADVFIDDWTDPDTPSIKPLLDDNAVVLISSGANFMLAHGLITYLSETQQWVTTQTERVLRSYIQHGPDRRMLELMTRPLPIPDKVDSWFVGFVC